MNSVPEKTGTAALIVGGIGFFSLLAQALLFRDFLAVFAGNELAAGVFFAVWLGWVAVGATLAAPMASRLVRWFLWLPLLYLPAFLLQKWGLLYARELAGVAEYAQWSLSRLIAVVAVVDAPVALLSGALMVTAAVWWRETAAAVSRVYVFDVLGCGAGALAVTLLLAGGVGGIDVFLTASAVLGAMVAWALWRRDRPRAGLTVLLAALVAVAALTAGWGASWQRALDRRQWERRLPGSVFRGALVTAQSRYLYGDRSGARVISGWGGIVETLPDREGALTAAAAALAQQPKPRRVLLIGSGSAALCAALTGLREVSEVVWLSSDPAYPAELLATLPPSLLPDRVKLVLPGADVRRYLREGEERFDLALVRLEAPVSLVMNRYFSRDFFLELRRAMVPGGVVGVSFPGGENYVGPELALIGASLLATMEGVFPRVVLRPGTSSCFYAGARDVVTDDPARLARRLAGTSLARTVPPEAVDTIYDLFRRDFQIGVYRRTLSGDYSVLLNTGGQPRLFLFSLLFYLRRGGVEIDSARLTLWLARAPAVTGGAAAAMLLLGAVSAWPGWFRRRGAGGELAFWRLGLLVAASSVSAMGLELLLLLRFQYDYGSLYLWFGLVNALFMSGMFIGGNMMERSVESKRDGKRGSFTLLAALLAAGCGGMALAGAAPLPWWFYAVAPAVLGMVAGAWLPRAAWMLSRSGGRTGGSAARLYALDSVGGALGALLAPLVLLPWCGLDGTLLILGALAGALGLVAWPEWRRRGVGRGILPVMVMVVGLAAFGVRAAAPVAVWSPDPKQLQGLGIKEELTPVTVMFENRAVIYYRGGTEAQPDGYLFRTADWVSGIKGYHGPIEMIAWTDGKGNLRSFIITATKDTRSYMLRVWKQRQTLRGKNIFRGEAAFPVDAVTGATFSANGIVQTLNAAGRRLYGLIRADRKMSAQEVTAPVPSAGKPVPVKTAERVVAKREPVREAPPPGQARNIDAARYQAMIAKGELSGHPAEFAAPVK